MRATPRPAGWWRPRGGSLEASARGAGFVSALRFVDRPSPNFDARTRAIDLVVLHYTGMQDAETALRRLTDPAPVAGAYPGPWQDKGAAPDAPLTRVSAHYVVGEDGVIYRIVPE